MKRHLLILLTTGMVLLLAGCQGNQLKTDEYKLTQEILLQEKDEAARTANEKLLADSLKNLPAGFRFKEDRSVDPSHPPMVIDIAGNLNNIKAFALSDVATEISYIRMEKVPDSAFSRVMKFKYYLMDKNIVAVNPSGILLYTRDGKYICTVVKNESTGIETKADVMIVTADNTFIGGGTTVWASGNNLFYKYRNTNTGQSFMMEYDCSQMPVTISNQFDPEKPDIIRALGNPVVDLNHEKNRPAPPKGSRNGMWGAGPEFLYSQTGTFLLDHNTWSSPLGNDSRVGGKYMLGIFNKHGDTLTTFTQFEKLTNFSKPLMRGTDFGTQYEDRGRLFFRNAFNDTVFLVIPPNRLFPVYVMELGKYKLSKQEGMDPDFNLAGKIIPEGWADTKDYIFLTFTRDSYDCPNTRKNKQLKLYHALFEKSGHKLFIVKGDPHDYDAEILENNLDGGLPVWPSSYMIGNHGEILISLKGRDLKKQVKSSSFSASTAPVAKKSELMKLARSVSDDEDILMIVE